MSWQFGIDDPPDDMNLRDLIVPMIVMVESNGAKLVDFVANLAERKEPICTVKEMKERLSRSEIIAECRKVSMTAYSHPCTLAHSSISCVLTTHKLGASS